jgi:MFS family permease
MTEETFSGAAAPRPMRAALAERARSSIVAVIAFLTLVDLFATQAILPSLALAYRVTPAAMGFAVNATTIGMAVSSLAVGLLSQRIDRKLGVVVCLAVLGIPTSLLAIAPDLMTFTCLRIAQGLCMAGAFTLTLAYLGERFMAAEAPRRSPPISRETSLPISSADSCPPRSPTISGSQRILSYSRS